MSEKLKVAEVTKRERWEGVKGKDFEFFKCKLKLTLSHPSRDHKNTGKNEEYRYSSLTLEDQN